MQGKCPYYFSVQVTLHNWGGPMLPHNRRSSSLEPSNGTGSRPPFCFKPGFLVAPKTRVNGVLSELVGDTNYKFDTRGKLAHYLPGDTVFLERINRCEKKTTGFSLRSPERARTTKRLTPAPTRWSGLS
ncbi:hypothetical protein TgHK011_003171 [Trichoderma gracile]|nr:hypothetical protein TgHK011_003171 [Trichoderma gracile]